MWSKGTLLGLVIGSMAAFAASAETGTLRWRGADNAIGLRAGNSDFRVPCGSVAFPCEGGGTSTLLYASAKAPRSISMQVGYLDAGNMLRMARPQGMNISVIGKTSVAPDLGVYGRVGTFFGKSGPSVASYGEGSGLSYGMGVSFELSRQASASVGVDTYDFRTATGDSQVRAASLGLQWRY